MSRVYLKKNAIVVRQAWMFASDLPEDVRPLSGAAEVQSKLATSESLLDISVARSILSNELDFFSSTGEKPEKPTPTPKEREITLPPRICPSGIRG